MVEDKFIINFNENIENKIFYIQIKHLNCSQHSKIDELIQKNKSVFARYKYDIGKISDYEAHIDLLEEKYCSKRPYRCTIEDKKEIEQQVINRKICVDQSGYKIKKQKTECCVVKCDVSLAWVRQPHQA